MWNGDDVKIRVGLVLESCFVEFCKGKVGGCEKLGSWGLQILVEDCVGQSCWL